MTLKIKSKYDFWTNVKVKTPTEDGGVEEYAVRVKFSFEPKKSRQQLNKILEALPAEQERLGADFMAESIIGWSGFHDESGAELEFNLERLAQVLEIPWIASAILSAWVKAISGNPAEGN